jgi:hypothetical protein
MLVNKNNIFKNECSSKYLFNYLKYICENVSGLRRGFMIIHTTEERLFAKFGRVIKGYDTKELQEALKNTRVPQEGTIYEASDEDLEKLDIAKLFSSNIYGGMPIQLGYCNGYNTRLNCLEYHRDSEINFANEDFILLLGDREDIINGVIDSVNVQAFLIKKNTLVEIYASTLHYAPCQTNLEKPFQVLVVLPKGTNGPKPVIEVHDKEDEYLFACNKWLLAHEESSEAKKGAVIGISNQNIDIKKAIQ